MSETVSLNSLLTALRAAAEATRLRLLAILARNELTVTELTRIMGQSQPRISRHLKLMCEAHLLHRHQEGSWVLYGIADSGPAAHIVQELISLLPDEDHEMDRDAQRLQSIQREHMRAATAYFEENARAWDDIRKLYVAEVEVEKAMLLAIDDMEVSYLLDLGTGTGRVLEIFSPSIQRGLGIDLSREMLAVARSKLESSNITNCQVRYGNIYGLAVDSDSVDVVTIHHVLHFLDDPAAVIKEAVRTLKSGGRVLIVDFAPHHVETLREVHAHRRLGFSDDEVNTWLHRAGAKSLALHHLSTKQSDAADQLVVTLWVGQTH